MPSSVERAEQWVKAQWREAQQTCSQEGNAGDESGTGVVPDSRVEGTQPGRPYRLPPPASLDEAVAFRGRTMPAMSHGLRGMKARDRW